MAHDIENAQKRLDRLRDKRKQREHREAVHNAGFNNEDDYDAWRVLEDLRHLTIAERRATSNSGALKINGGTIINAGSTGGPAGFNSHRLGEFTVNLGSL